MDYSKYAKQWAIKRNSGQHFAHDLLEKPAIRSLLPDTINGLNVLCLGCGSGEECDWFYQKKAKKVIGVDNADGLVEYAKMQFPNCQFIMQDVLKSDFKPASFDLIYSSLTFHYIKDWNLLFAKIYTWLKPQGQLVFSCHHPLKWGAKSTKNKNYTKFIMGYEKNKDNGDYKIYGDYLTQRAISEKLFGNLEITHYHRPFSEMLKTFIENKFVIKECLEPLPILEAKTKKADFYEVHNKIPLFIVWKLGK